MNGKLIDFYSGFEGDGEVIIYGADTISIWDGYIDPILGVLLKVENDYREDGAAFGIVYDWVTCTGWNGITFDKHLVMNLEDEIYAFSQFDITLLDEMEYNGRWKQKIIDVHKAILELFIDAQEKNIDVYIQDS